MKVLLQTHDLAGTSRWGELFRRTLEDGHKMLQQRPTSDDETGWAIYHDSFRQYLLESGTVSVSREWAQERWLEVCKDWKGLASQEPSLHRYILRHYAEHLYEKCPMTNERMTDEQMTNYAELCRLALDSDFKQAQTEYLPKEPNLPLKTVQLALNAAIQLEDAPMMARLLMEHAKRAQSEETPLQAWRRGHRERALELATDIVFKRNHKLGTLWSLLLAWVAESEGEQEWSKCFLNEVRKRWEGGKLTELGESLILQALGEDWQGKMAVFLLGELGQVEGAVEVAGLVLDDESKRKLTKIWASKRLFDRALKVAEGIEKAWERAWALAAIAKGMAKAGMFDQALKVAEGIEDAWERAEALREIAEGMAKAGMIDWAKEVFEQTLKVAEGIEWAWEWAKALREIAVEMAKAGMFDQALKVAEGIEDAWRRSEALRTIAEEMAKVGMFDQALKAAEGIKAVLLRVVALSAIAGEMARAGMTDWVKEVFEQALKVAEGIKDARLWASALREIAVEMAKAGVMERAKEVFDQALKVAEGIEWASERSNALRAIAERMVRAGEVEGAVGIVEREMAVRTKGLPSVLKALAERAKQGDEKSKKEGFLRLLPLCGWSLEFAYKACGLLAWLYPERGEEIAGVIAATGD
jgi:tetratricopeptide (TPR) repeat protein